MADQNEVFRMRLKEIMQRRQATFTAVLNEAKAAGEIPKSVKTADAAEFFLCSFEGRHDALQGLARHEAHEDISADLLRSSAANRRLAFKTAS